MLTPLRTVAVTKAAILITVLAVTVAFGAKDIRRHGTPRGKPAPAGFKITGKASTALRPGRSAVLNLRIINAHRWPIRIRRISVAIKVDRAHDRAGCARVVHYRQRAMPRRTYPITVPARSRRTLRQLGVRVLPRVFMLDLPSNQNACKGAKLTLRYAGVSQRAGAPRAR